MKIKATIALLVLGVSCNNPKSNETAEVTNEQTYDKSFSGQIDDSIAIKRLGLKIQDTTMGFVTLRKYVSLKKYCPKVTHQNWGTCYSYASAYAARTILYNFTIGDSITPDSNVFSPGFLQRLVFGTNRFICKHRGTDTHKACGLMGIYGCLKLKDYPDDCSNMVISKALWKEAQKYKITSVGLYEGCASNEYKIQQIKKSLNQNRPVVICINNSDSFYSKEGDPEIWIPTEDDRKEINCSYSNHALCVIGYDDRKYGGAFEIMNSYSTHWKGDGFIWVKYSDFADYASYAIEIANP